MNLALKLAPKLAEADWAETWELARTCVASLPELEVRGTPPSPGSPDVMLAANGTCVLASAPEVALVGAPSLGEALAAEELDDETRKLLRPLSRDARTAVTLFARATLNTQRQLRAFVANAFHDGLARPLWSDEAAEDLGIHVSTMRALVRRRFFDLKGRRSRLTDLLLDPVGACAPAGLSEETLAAGGVRLDIPGDALDSDHHINLCIVTREYVAAPEGTFLVTALRLGPEDGRFKKPLRFAFQSRGPANVVQWAAGSWQPIDGILRPSAASEIAFDVSALGMWAFCEAR